MDKARLDKMRCIHPYACDWYKGKKCNCGLANVLPEQKRECEAWLASLGYTAVLWMNHFGDKYKYSARKDGVDVLYGSVMGSWMGALLDLCRCIEERHRQSNGKRGIIQYRNVPNNGVFRVMGRQWLKGTQDCLRLDDGTKFPHFRLDTLVDYDPVATAERKE